MAKVPVAVRLERPLVEWLDGYAKERGVSRQSLLESVIVSFREDCEGGVPGVAGVQAVKPLAPRPKPRALPDGVMTMREVLRERQVRLNKEMGWDKS